MMRPNDDSFTRLSFVHLAWAALTAHACYLIPDESEKQMNTETLFIAPVNLDHLKIPMLRNQIEIILQRDR